MKPISTDLENIFQPVQLREDEYLNGEAMRLNEPRSKSYPLIPSTPPSSRSRPKMNSG